MTAFILESGATLTQMDFQDMIPRIHRIGINTRGHVLIEEQTGALHKIVDGSRFCEFRSEVLGVLCQR